MIYLLISTIFFALAFIGTAWMWKRAIRERDTAIALERLAQDSARTWYQKFCEAKGMRSENIPVMDEIWPEEIS